MSWPACCSNSNSSSSSSSSDQHLERLQRHPQRHQMELPLLWTPLMPAWRAPTTVHPACSGVTRCTRGLIGCVLVARLARLNMSQLLCSHKKLLQHELPQQQQRKHQHHPHQHRHQQL